MLSFSSNLARADTRIMATLRRIADQQAPAASAAPLSRSASCRALCRRRHVDAGIVDYPSEPLCQWNMEDAQLQKKYRDAVAMIAVRMSQQRIEVQHVRTLLDSFNPRSI